MLSLSIPMEIYAQAGSKIQEPIYVVDIQKVISESVIGRAARNNIEEEIKKKRIVLEKLQLEATKIKEEIDKQSALLSPEALRTKQDALLKKQRDLERTYQDQQEEIAKKNSESMGKIVKEIDEVVKKLAEQNNYKLVMEKDMRVVVYASDKYDISDEVVKLLDAEKVGL